jgi:histone H3/H4
MWRELDAEGKREYEDASAEDKERYTKEINALKAKGIDVDGMLARQKSVALASSGTGEGFTLPLQRVKRIAKSHPKATTITSEGTAALIEAIGMFVESVASDAAIEAQRAGRKTVRYHEARTAIRRSGLKHFITAADFPEP